MPRRVTANRYVAPLREGGSLPGLVEADDDGLYVVKFSGAGQGPGTLVAELLAGELARELGLPVPEVVLVDIDPELARAEPDREIQALIESSPGLNAGLDFLPGALAYSPGCGFEVGAEQAADVMWFDGLLANVDRTPRNPNLLVWHRRLWLIDHGAALYHQHGDFDPERDGRRSFPLLREHVLAPVAGSLAEAGDRLAPKLGARSIPAALEAIPDAWLTADGSPSRADYAAYLGARLESRAFLDGVQDAAGRH